MGSAQRSREFPRVAQAEIEPLASHRMQGLRRIANEYCARRHGPPRVSQHERKYLSCAKQAKSPQFPAKRDSQLHAKFVTI